MTDSDKLATKQARAFAEETALVLLWELKRRRRQACKAGSLTEASKIRALISRTKMQRQAMRRMDNALVIHACADEWQQELSYLQTVADAPSPTTA